MSDPTDPAGQQPPDPSGQPQYGQPQYGQPNPYGGGYGAYGGYGRPLSMPRPKTHLVGAILTTLFCCMPAGIVAIVFASKVDSAYRAGDFEGSLRASSTAQFWVWISVGLSVIGTILVVAYVITSADSTTVGGY